MAETYRSVEVPGYGDVEFPDSMSDDEVADAIRRNVLKQEPARPSPLKPEGPAFTAEVPGLAQGPVPAYQPAEPPPPARHGLIASMVQGAGFPGAAGKIEEFDQALPGVVKKAVTPVGEAFEEGGGPAVAALTALNPTTLPGLGLAAIMNPSQPIAAASGMVRGQLEEALPAFLSAENLLLVGLSEGTGIAAKLATEMRMTSLGAKGLIAAAARLGEVGETAKYVKQLELAERRFGRAAVVAKLGATVETAMALGYGGKGGLELWDAAKRGDWKGVAQAGLSMMVAGGIGAAGIAHRAGTPVPGPRTDTAPFLKEAAIEAGPEATFARGLETRPMEGGYFEPRGTTEIPAAGVPKGKKVSPEAAFAGKLPARSPVVPEGPPPPGGDWRSYLKGEHVPTTPEEVLQEAHLDRTIAGQEGAAQYREAPRGVQPRLELPEGPATVPEALQIAEEAETARRILDLIDRGQIVLPPDVAPAAIEALKIDAGRGVQPPAAPGAPVPVEPSLQTIERGGGPPGAQPEIVQPGAPVPGGPVVEGGPVPLGEPVQNVQGPQYETGQPPFPLAPRGIQEPSVRLQLEGTGIGHRAAPGEPLPPPAYEGEPPGLETIPAEPGTPPKPVRPRDAKAALAALNEPGAPVPSSEGAGVAPGPVEALVAGRTAIGEAPPGVAPGVAAPGEPPPSPLDVAEDAAAARLKASAGLKGTGPTEAHAGLSTQNLRDMATVAAAKLSRVTRPLTRESWEANFRRQFGKTPPKEVMDRIWEVSQDAAALGRAAGPRVAQAYAEEMAGPPKNARVQEALGLGDTEGQLAARVNNHLRNAISHVEKTTIGFQLKGGQIERMRENLQQLVATGHMGRGEQAALAKEGTAPREQTTKLSISEESFAKTLKALEVSEANAQQVLQDLRTSGIALDKSPGGIRVGAGFRGSPELKQAIDAVLKNLFDAHGDLGRAAKAVAVTKSTWARIGHRQQEALRLSVGLQAELDRIPGAMERLKTAGLELRGIQTTHFRRPFLTEMSEILRRGFTGGTEDLKAFGDDLRRMWRLQFSNRSFIMDVTSDAASLVRGAADAAGHDAWLAIRGQDLTLPRFRSFLDATRMRAGRESFQPVAGGVEQLLGMTAYGEPIRPGTPAPEGAGWLHRAWHAAHREGAAGEATLRTGSNRYTKAMSILMDEFSVRGLYMKGAADTFTKRFIAQGYVLERALREGASKKLTGADLETFVESYRKAPPPDVVKEAGRRGADAGFNQELSAFERRWFRDNPIVQWLFDAFPGWALQHTRWLRDTAGFAIYKAYKNPAEAGVFKEADIAGAVGQALAGWGAFGYVVKSILPFVDAETGDIVDKITKNRMPLRGIEPLATLVTLGFMTQRDFGSAGKMLPYSSLPFGAALSSQGGGGIAGGPINQLRELLADPSRSWEQFTNQFINVVNRMIPGRPGLEVIKAFTDPISRRGLGAPIPGYSKTLPEVLDPATGKPRQPRYELPIVSDILGRLGLATDLPAIFGTQTPGARRVVNPVEKLLERFDVPGSAAKRVPGIYRNIPDLPGNLSSRDLTQVQRDKWRQFFGEERQRILGPLAKDYDRLNREALADAGAAKRTRARLEMLDATAARNAVTKLMRWDSTLRPTAMKREAPYTGPYADRPGYKPGEPPPS